MMPTVLAPRPDEHPVRKLPKARPVGPVSRCAECACGRQIVKEPGNWWLHVDTQALYCEVAK